MSNRLLLLFFLAFLPSLPLAQEAESWETLAAEWEAATLRWSQGQRASRQPFDGKIQPDLDFVVRFEALAERGETRAVLWLLRRRVSMPEELAARRGADFERVRRAGDAEWVARALLEFARDGRGPDLAQLTAYLEDMSTSKHPPELRSAALLALATATGFEDPAQASEMRVRAAAVFTGASEAAPGSGSSAEELAALAGQLVTRMNELELAWFDASYYDGGDGIYYERADNQLRPQEVWRPSLEALAARGAPKARNWVLFNTWVRDEPTRERLRTYFDAFAREPLEPDVVRVLPWRIPAFADQLGAEFVESRMTVMLESASEDVRRGLMLGLGRGLCEAAGEDEAQRARGLALLREVCAAWPDSDEAERATGKLFRYENILVGKPMPDFEAKDVDGVAFKLSDYRGKVTVIDFWGFW